MRETLTHPFVMFWLVKFLIRTGTVTLALCALYWLVSKMSERAKTFWIGIFSDGGCPSFSRVASALILVNCLAWDALYVYSTMHGHGGIQLPNWEHCSAQALLIGTPYGLNVGGKTISSFGKRPDLADCAPNQGKG